MRLVLVGPGIMSIPPKGWGAVESLIWDYYNNIKKYYSDIDVHIVNESNHETIAEKVNALNPDVVHLHYDDHIFAMKGIRCKHILITSHYGYLDQVGELDRSGYPKHIYYYPRLMAFINSGFMIFALSPSNMNKYLQYECPLENVVVQHNGANDELFHYTDRPEYPDRSIYLAKIDGRKAQYKYQGIDNLYFAGGIADHRFYPEHPRYLGEWQKDVLYRELTHYGNLVLLSDGEAHALVCCEALICGLGLVISEYATANLDTSLPFIDVIPSDKLDDIPYVEDIIKQNRARSIQMREEIREYGLKHFSWKVVVAVYVDRLNRLYKNNGL